MWTYAIAVLVVLLTSVYMYMLVRRRVRFPPGPAVVPVLGSYLFMNCQISRAHHTFTELAAIYGSVSSFALGKQWFVVLNGYDAVRQAHVKSFSDCVLILTQKRADLCTSQVEHEVSESEKHAPSAIEILKSLYQDERRPIESVIEQVSQQIIVEIQITVLQNKNLPIDPTYLLNSAVAIIASHLMCAEVFGYNDVDLYWLINKMETISDLSYKEFVKDFIPLFRYKGHYKKTCLDRVYATEHVQKTLNDKQHIKTPTDNQNNAKDKDKTTQRRVPEPNSVFTFFKEGLETVGSTLSWALLYMANHAEVQYRVHEELDMVLGPDVLFPDLSLKDSLPYTCATLMEVQRLACVRPFTHIRHTMKTMENSGYHIPTGTMVS